jgi:hypothetical protein
MSRVELMGDKTGGRLRDLYRALPVGHLLAQLFDLRQLFGCRADPVPGFAEG